MKKLPHLGVCNVTQLRHIEELIARAKVAALAANDLASVPRLRDRGEKYRLVAWLYLGRADAAFEKYEREAR